MDIKELKQYFELNCKPSASERSGQKLGPEYECLVLIPDRKDASGQSCRPLGMDEQEGVPGVLRRFQEIGATRGEIWEGNFEGENGCNLRNAKSPHDHRKTSEKSCRN